ncbi:MAG: hypothetical protein IJU71_01745 [Selenomonadaceae bacterium]|nr:hypothetical protein [Selenomonadaceae bacterium]
MRLTFLILALIFFVRNCLLPLAADDYSYAFIWDGDGRGNILEGVPDTIERVDSIGDLIASQWSHYMTWGGRTPAHTLVQLFVWLGKPLFDVLNTAMFVALIVLIARLADVRLTLRHLLWIALGLWVATPEWISTMEWLTGACNYLWMGVVQLLFLKFFSTSTNRLIMIPLGLMAGWSNEAGGLATLFIAVALMIGQQKIRSAHRIGLLSFALGYALLILAPGNFNRLALTQPNFSLTTAVLVEHLSPFVEVISQQLLLLVPLVIVFSRRGASSSIKIFTAAGLLVPTVMMFSPAFPLRSCFMSTIFLLIASTAALDRLNIDPKKYFKPLIAIGIVWALSVAGSLYSDISIFRQMDHRMALIDELRAEPLPLLKVPPLNPTRRLEKILGLRIFGSAAMSIGGELSDNPREGHNVTFAKYHGIKAIAVER